MGPVFTLSDNPNYKLFASAQEWLEELLIDIKNASKYIYLETFRFSSDRVGNVIGKALIEKAEEGVDVKVIVDSWGTNKRALFTEMMKKGVSVRFFKQITISFNHFSKNHERNHRKIIAIDNEISYIGSANISFYSLKWRESILKMKSDITPLFKKAFMDNFNTYKKRFKQRKYYKDLYFNNFKIIRELPSLNYQRARNYFTQLIHHAKKSIQITTPYFLPGKSIINQLIQAAERGVDVTVIIPKKSDVKMVDYIRDLYLGNLHRHNVHIRMFTPCNLHAKTMLVDDEVFAIGSSNLDYRSFRYMYEINLSGNDPDISNLLSQFMNDTVLNSRPFNYKRWARRPLYQKIVGRLLIPIRKLL